jgi:hypothetical protein
MTREKSRNKGNGCRYLLPHQVRAKCLVPWIPQNFPRNAGSLWPLVLQLNNSEECYMPVILWLLGVPLSVIVIAALFGAF